MITTTILKQKSNKLDVLSPVGNDVELDLKTILSECEQGMPNDIDANM